MSPSVLSSTGFCTELISSLGVNITQLVTDSREIKRGDTFVAYPGEKTDGRQHIAQAIAHGANAVMWEASGFNWNPAWQVPNLAVADLRLHAGEIDLDLRFKQTARQSFAASILIDLGPSC